MKKGFLTMSKPARPAAPWPKTEAEGLKLLMAAVNGASLPPKPYEQDEQSSSDVEEIDSNSPEGLSTLQDLCYKQLLDRGDTRSLCSLPNEQLVELIVRLHNECNTHKAAREGLETELHMKALYAYVVQPKLYNKRVHDFEGSYAKQKAVACKWRCGAYRLAFVQIPVTCDVPWTMLNPICTGAGQQITGRKHD